MTPFRRVKLVEDLYRSVDELGLPAVLKTAGFGYDGKGQSKIKSRGDIEPVFAELKGAEAIVEPLVEFEKEVSVVCARGQDGEFTHYGVIENEHSNHILDVSFGAGRYFEAGL